MAGLTSIVAAATDDCKSDIWKRPAGRIAIT